MPQDCAHDVVYGVTNTLFGKDGKQEMALCIHCHTPVPLTEKYIIMENRELKIDSYDPVRKTYQSKSYRMYIRADE